MVKIAPKTYILILVFLLVPAFSFAGQFKVTRVYDGDTLVARGHDIDIKVRLVGIDAPETSKKKRDPGQPYSQQSKKHLGDIVKCCVRRILGGDPHLLNSIHKSDSFNDLG